MSVGITRLCRGSPNPLGDVENVGFGDEISWVMLAVDEGDFLFGEVFCFGVDEEFKAEEVDAGFDLDVVRPRTDELPVMNSAALSVG